MFNYIILVLLIVILVLSIILVITENMFVRNSNEDKFLRKYRLILREKSGTSFCLGAGFLLIIGLITGDCNFYLIRAAIGILFVTLAVLHSEDFFNTRKSRKKASLKKQKINCLKAVDEVKELPQLVEIIPSGEN